MSFVVIDTNILIYLIKDDKIRLAPAEPFIRGTTLLISFATIGELYEGWCKKFPSQDKEQQKLAEVQKRGKVVPFNIDVCAAWGRTRAARKHRTISENDAWIAATALALKCPLVTADYDDFVDVPDLTLFDARMG